MLEHARGLSPAALEAIATLESATVGADGGRLKLEWGVLERRPTDAVQDLLFWEDGRLAGFAGLYGFGHPTAEVTGMVHPDRRRRGIGSALLDEATQLCRQGGHRQMLLVAPRTSLGARVLAESRGAVLEHSEHALVLTGEVADGPSDPALHLRPGTRGDLDDVARILGAAFGHPWSPLDLEAPGEPTLVAELDGRVVATLRLHQSASGWGVYGLAVEPDRQGRGIGRDLLRRVCRMAGDAGVHRVHLEVEVDNDRALGLYTSLGFTREATEDYFDVPLSRP